MMFIGFSLVFHDFSHSTPDQSSFPKNVLQFGHECVAFWQPLTQYGIKQQPSQQPQTQNKHANKCVFVAGSNFTLVAIDALHDGHVIDWGSEPKRTTCTVAAAGKFSLLSFHLQINNYRVTYLAVALWLEAQMILDPCACWLEDIPEGWLVVGSHCYWAFELMKR